MIIVRIETDIAPPMRTPAAFSYKAAGIFLHERPRWWKHWRGRLVMYQRAGGRRV